ncbi:ubiquinone biosynthesis protein UbiA [Paenibacillus yonginensis]|uniref:Ubiquinone biosynthesis protein UbiA n=1 Tax=Paenibacillus yonginensis TaxID=1462996 RepID=A0A1B1N760_9BACL|nr:prenyltransferase [Paenibacillus yonginensis]ANS77270.1 ubiquinone biosynthesis protein UbiA [Paenibacillus yonginensis]
MSKWQLFLKATRFYSLPVMLVPVVLGTAAAYVWEQEFHPVLFILAFLGAGAAHLFSNMINDLWDYRNGTDTAAQENSDLVSTHSGLLTGGIVSEKAFATLTWLFLAFAVVCGVLLCVFSGWELLYFVVVGALIAYFYVAPPLRFGYRGMGYSEVAILFAFGIMPVTGSYFVQTGEFSLRSVLLSLPVGILTTLLLFNHHFLHWQSDKQVGKRTLVVVWGERKALVLSRIMTVLAYVLLLVCIFAGILPFYAVLALLSVLPLYRVYRGLQAQNPSPAYLPLMGASLKASMWCGIIMSAALILDSLI